MKKNFIGIAFIIGWLVLTAGIGNKAHAGGDALAEAGFTRPEKKISVPAFSLSDVKGNLVNLENYRGKPVLLFFWTTW